MNGADPTTARQFCTGTLIGCRTFVTAAHCVGSEPDPSDFGVFLQHAGLVPVSSVTVHPGFDLDTWPMHDIAVFELATDVEGIEPSAINLDTLGPYDPFPARAGTLVGFGQTQMGGNDFTLKRSGLVATATCEQEPGPPAGGNDELVCWVFEKPLGGPGENSNTCSGDSGGPLFMDLGNGPVLAGITAGGTNFTCLADDLAFDVNVQHYASFLLGALAGDSTQACGTMPPIGGPGSDVVSYEGYLASFPTARTYEVPVSVGTDRLVVTSNARDSASLLLPPDFDLYVRHGSPPTSTDFDCATIGPSQIGDCSFDSPLPGTWFATLERIRGDGEFQLNATRLGGDAPVCGNGAREPGEDCDGADDHGCPGACELSCLCPHVCEAGAFELTRLVAKEKRFVLKGWVHVGSGEKALVNLDPRTEFDVVVNDGAVAITPGVPGYDRGWERSKPDKGKFKWRGDIAGLRRVRMFDRVAKRGSYKVTVIGKGVANASTLDSAASFVELLIGGRCADSTPQ